jgi:hypothetical protein
MPVAVLLQVLYVGGGGALLYPGLRFVRAAERRGVDRAELAALRGVVARLEGALERTDAEVERLAEGQQFTTRLLAERPGPGSPAA